MRAQFLPPAPPLEEAMSVREVVVGRGLDFTAAICCVLLCTGGGEVVT